MNLLKQAKYIALGSVVFATSAMAEDFNIKYSSNYLMPAYVHFKNTNSSYSVKAKINIPLYKIVFSSDGNRSGSRFNMVNYKDLRNGKTYAMSKISGKELTYGKVKDGKKTKTVPLALPTYDLFTMAYQLTYFDKLPNSFQITNGKKLYPMKNVIVKKSVKDVKDNGKSVKEITYKFKTGTKDVMVKKHQGEKFPRYISYSRDGDNYELEFDSFVK